MALGIGLTGVVKRFARGLGQVMSRCHRRLRHETANPYSANAGLDFRVVLTLLRRVVLLADRLKAQLRTPAVAIALARFVMGRASARQDRPQPAGQHALDDMQLRIACRRTGDNRQDRFGGRGQRAGVQGFGADRRRCGRGGAG